jgi:methionyl-tRNA synthetase
VAKLCQQSGRSLEINPTDSFADEYQQHFANFDTSLAAAWVVNQIAGTDQFLSQTKPWTLAGDQQAAILTQAVERILLIAYHLRPFMPDTATAIEQHFSLEKIEALQPLFPRL